MQATVNIKNKSVAWKKAPDLGQPWLAVVQKLVLICAVACLLEYLQHIVSVLLVEDRLDDGLNQVLVVLNWIGRVLLLSELQMRMSLLMWVMSSLTFDWLRSCTHFSYRYLAHSCCSADYRVSNLCLMAFIMSLNLCTSLTRYYSYLWSKLCLIACTSRRRPYFYPFRLLTSFPCGRDFTSLSSFYSSLLLYKLIRSVVFPPDKTARLLDCWHHHVVVLYHQFLWLYSHHSS